MDRKVSACFIAVFLTAGCTENLTSGIQEWPYYGGDQAATKYSPLGQINRDNVEALELAWEWDPGERASKEFRTVPSKFESTPLMIDNVLYLSTAYGRVVALDAENGAPIWAYDPETRKEGQGYAGIGFVHRGVSPWWDNGKLRIFINVRNQLISLDAGTGLPVATFGRNGVVDLSHGLIREIDPTHFESRSPPIVYKDLVIVGSHIPDPLIYASDPPGDVRAYDARTGEQVWRFNTVPQEGEFGNDTWENDSWKTTGHTNVWAPMSLDEERGLVYLPVSTPSNDFYGGRRPGANLFAESIVCLDAATGDRVWHYQLVHHGVWDYDAPAAPNLVTIRVDGEEIAAVAQVTKMGFTFVFDRVTGEPVWPIEERPVPQSDVPGEKTWPTQPFPTKPPPFAEQGVTLDDAFDLTPELKAAAQEQMKKYRFGPIFTPPSLEGTLTRPGALGGANWGGAAFDPETGFLYVKSSEGQFFARLERRQERGRKNRVADEPAPGEPSKYPTDAEWLRASSGASFISGLPLLKPPYGTLTAIDLNTGTVAWRVTLGDTPSLRKHPSLKDVQLPVQLGARGPPGAIVTEGGLIFVGGGDEAFHAFDKATGRELWRAPLPQRTEGTPMTYQSRSGRQFVVIATGSGAGARLVAFALPRNNKPGQ